jgi:hypothetical protein
LQIEEFVTWNCLTKCSIEQTSGWEPRTMTELMESREFEALKEILNQHIPLVRFLEISHADFVNKIRPYKSMIPKQIYEEVEGFYYKNTLPKQ